MFRLHLPLAAFAFALSLQRPQLSFPGFEPVSGHDFRGKPVFRSDSKRCRSRRPPSLPTLRSYAYSRVSNGFNNSFVDSHRHPSNFLRVTAVPCVVLVSYEVLSGSQAFVSGQRTAADAGPTGLMKNHLLPTNAREAHSVELVLSFIHSFTLSLCPALPPPAFSISARRKLQPSLTRPTD